MFNVVCRTADCINDGVVIQIMSDDDVPIVLCGPCGNEITDITRV